MRLQELLDQIAVGAVDLDAVEAGRHGVARACRKPRPRRRFHWSQAHAASRRAPAFRPPSSPSGRRRSAPPKARPAARRRAGTTNARRGRHARAAERSTRPWREPHRPRRAIPRSALRIDAGHAGISVSRRHHGRGLGDDQAARRRALAHNIRHSAAAARGSASPRASASTAPSRRGARAGRGRPASGENNDRKIHVMPRKGISCSICDIVTGCLATRSIE